MKRRTALAVLVATAVLVPLSHLELRSADDSWLLWVDGRPVDAAGALSDGWLALTRDCRRVQPLPPSSAEHAHALEALRQYSPPDSRSARIAGLIGEGGWLLAQARFEGLENAVVLLRQTAAGWAIAEGGVWSGRTHPHRPGPFIRRYLRARVPDAPRALTDCLGAPT